MLPSVAPPITVAQLRADYVEFANSNAYPDSAVSYWLNLAGLMILAPRWSTVPGPNSPYLSMQGVAIELFVAHNLTLERQSQLSAQLPAQDGLPGPAGVSTGPVASTSVGPVSVSYDTSSALDQKAGHWSLTTYGQRFARLAKQVGMGGMQVNTPGCSPVGTVVGPGGYGWL